MGPKGPIFGPEGPYRCSQRLQPSAGARFFFLLVLINGVGIKPQDLERKLGEKIAKRKAINKIQEKYVDDMTQAVSIDLRLKASIDLNPTHPLQYLERTGHVLPVEKHVLQQELEKLMKYAEEYEMLLNESKTKVIIFNNATSIDIMLKLSHNNDNVIELVE